MTAASFGPALPGVHLSSVAPSFWSVWKIPSGKVNIAAWLPPNGWIQLAPPAPGCFPNERLGPRAVSRDHAHSCFPPVPERQRGMSQLVNPADVFRVKFPQLRLEGGPSPGNLITRSKRRTCFPSSSREWVPILTQMALSAACWAVS